MSRQAPPKITSGMLKRTLAHHLYWRLHYTIVVDEFKFMDMFGVRNNGYGVEFEIKVSEADFDREMKIIRMKQDRVEKWGKDWAKWQKHQQYLGFERTRDQMSQVEQILIDHGMHDTTPPYYPNDFYFFVPDYLAMYAATQCQGLPYGVISTKVNGGYGDSYVVVKKSQKLHSTKVPHSTIHELAHALTIRSRMLYQPEARPYDQT